MRVYLAGPMTGIPDENRPAFRTATAMLRERGFEVMSPDEFDDTHPLEGEPVWAAYLRRDLREGVLQAQAVVCLPGWRASRGALLEVTVASQLGLPVFEMAANRDGSLGRLHQLDQAELPTPGVATT